MSRPRRLSGLQCLQLLEQIAQDESGDESGSDSDFIASDNDSLGEANDQALSFSESSSETEPEEERLMCAGDSTATTVQLPSNEESAASMRGIGQRRGRGRGIRCEEKTVELRQRAIGVKCTSLAMERHGT